MPVKVFVDTNILVYSRTSLNRASKNSAKARLSIDPVIPGIRKVSPGSFVPMEVGKCESFLGIF